MVNTRWPFVVTGLWPLGVPIQACQSGLLAWWFGDGTRHSVARRPDGSLVGWGSNLFGQRSVPAGSFIDVDCGDWHTVALRADGTVIRLDGIQTVSKCLPTCICVTSRRGATSIGLRWFDDCDNNGIPDQSEIDDGDCDANGVLDVCELHNQDGNQDGVLDQCQCAEDLDQDGGVWLSDILRVLSAWGPCSGGCIEDLDEDGEVGYADLVRLLSSFGPCQ